MTIPVTEDNQWLLICSVGGSPEPVRTSVDWHEPTHVIYVASPDSRKTIRQEIEASLTWKGVLDAEVITLEDPQNLLDCVRDIRAGIESSLQKMHLSEEALFVADITGGTKVMSAALTLVMMDYHSRFSYVGGDRRTKGGLGIVQAGYERCLQLDNPWNVMGVREIRGMVHAFNAGQFSAALETARDLAGRSTSGRQKFYRAVCDLTEAYYQWDAFSHGAAHQKLRQAIGRLEPYAMQNELLGAVCDACEKSREILAEVENDVRALRTTSGHLPPSCGMAYLRDLLANAQRKAELGCYDDAVARLYSAVEKSAKIALRVRYGIDNSNVDMGLVPECWREELREGQGDDARIRIGLQKSFLLLDALNDPLGKAYRMHEDALKRSLEARNISLLAHGYTPVGEDRFRDLFAVALVFLGMRKEDLPSFPRLNWKSLLL
ncbi:MULTISPECIES: TIGR02710 family CRISPR-associated CARF protein [unclassified Desulfovibrio]|uniref:TIGR02710 family CRISPR-associated CARF protein n=1 Tax=unclassified Desulfovibrio TaxID=2593640 RepID=UPI000F5E3693|nr:MULTISPECIES: TIGR02710 family CRISPR-associated CARF protein [unclassified Desulfovibrio]RRD69558.1 TIGR02710 family CRISPR-associated protein [Desulfovibrio sp. OH1209_COT-279]RRD86222.1 TIGR02710 family CRISPR-associated protein [Desulfovibrio sp. OH1186_COT-070]